MRDDAGLIALVQAGGLLMIPLLLCALATLALIALGGWRLWQATRHTEEVLQRVASLGREGKLDDAARVARETPGPVAAVMLAGLTAPDVPAAESALDRSARAERTRLERGLALLDTVGGVALLLPALGVVAALVAHAGAGDGTGAAWTRTDVEAGLITFAAGLGIALVASLGRHFLASRVAGLVVDMEKGTGAVQSILWDRPVAGR